MNNELKKRIEQINAQESERHTAFANWVRSPEFKLATGRHQADDLCDYVLGLLAEIGDLQEVIARNEANE